MCYNCVQSELDLCRGLPPLVMEAIDSTNVIISRLGPPLAPAESNNSAAGAVINGGTVASTSVCLDYWVAGKLNVPTKWHKDASATMTFCMQQQQ